MFKGCLLKTVYLQAFQGIGQPHAHTKSFVSPYQSGKFDNLNKH